MSEIGRVELNGEVVGALARLANHCAACRSQAHSRCWTCLPELRNFCLGVGETPDGSNRMARIRAAINSGEQVRYIGQDEYLYGMLFTIGGIEYGRTWRLDDRQLPASLRLVLRSTNGSNCSICVGLDDVELSGEKGERT